MKLFLAAKETNSKRNFILNMTGSMCNALSSMILLSLVTRFSGSVYGGIFSLAFSTAQLLQTIGCFETRVIQATDVNGETNFKTYFNFRLLTSIAMMICAFIYIFVSDFSWDKSLVILLICLYKAIDALSDSFQGLYQQHLRIDISGTSLGSRVMVCTVVFGISLAITKNLILSSVLMLIMEIIWLFLFDYHNGKAFAKYDERISGKKMTKLLLTCLPLCIGSFMVNYMMNAPKYAIDMYLNDVIQNVYGFLVMPAFVINLFSLFVFRPLLTTLSIKWNNRQYKSAASIIGKCSLWVLFLTVGAMFGAYLLGPFILYILSGLNFDVYRIQLVCIMFGGGINAMIMLLYNVLAVMRKQNTIFIGYAIGFVVSIVLTPILVKSYSLNGAVVGYIIPMVAVVFFFALCAIIQFVRASKEIQKGANLE